MEVVIFLFATVFALFYLSKWVIFTIYIFSRMLEKVFKIALIKPRYKYVGKNNYVRFW